MKQKTIEINIKKYSEFASPNKKGIIKKTVLQFFHKFIFRVKRLY